MQSFCYCSNESSSLPTSIFREHESHITLRCQFLHCFMQDSRKTERKRERRTEHFSSCFLVWHLYVYLLARNHSLSQHLPLVLHSIPFCLFFLLFMKETSFCTQSDFYFYFSTWILFSLMPDTILALKSSWRWLFSQCKANASTSRACSQNDNPTPKTQHSFPSGMPRYCRNPPKFAQHPGEKFPSGNWTLQFLNLLLSKGNDRMQENTLDL